MRNSTIRLSVRERRELKKRMRSTNHTVQELVMKISDRLQDTELLLQALGSGRVDVTQHDYDLFLNTLTDSEPDSNQNNSIQVTDKIIQAFYREIERTGVTPTELIKRTEMQGRIAGVTFATIYNWLNGKIGTASTYTIERALKLYSELPDKRI